MLFTAESCQKGLKLAAEIFECRFFKLRELLLRETWKESVYFCMFYY